MFRVCALPRHGNAWDFFLYCTQSKLGCFLLAELSLVYVAEVNFHLNSVSVSMMICQTLAVGQACGGVRTTGVNKRMESSTRGTFWSPRWAGPGTVTKLIDDHCDRNDGVLEGRRGVGGGTADPQSRSEKAEGGCKLSQEPKGEQERNKGRGMQGCHKACSRQRWRPDKESREHSKNQNKVPATKSQDKKAL